MEESPKRTRILTIAPLCFLPEQASAAPKTAKTWRKGDKEKLFYDWGNVVPDDDELRIK